MRLLHIWLGRLPVGWRLLVEKMPLLALAAADCAIVLSTHMSFRLKGAAESLSLATRVANALVACTAYLGQSLCANRRFSLLPA